MGNPDLNTCPIFRGHLSHRRVETTARYVPVPRDSVREATERVAVSFAADVLAE